MKRFSSGLLLSLILGGGSPVVEAVSVTPIVRISALGGQYFTGQTHSSGANVDASIVPVITFTPRLHLIPIYISGYNETQSVYNFLGENTLINKQLDQTGVLRLSWAASDAWRVKPRVGYKREWIQQSTDGSLSGGLFNYTRLFSGLSAERIISQGSLEFGYEFGQTRYLNYQSLDADPRLTTTGITTGAGVDVLNFNTHELSLIHQWATDDNAWSLAHRLVWLRESFRDQKVITTDAGGFEAFEDNQRHDDILNLSLQQTWRPSQRWTFGLGEGVQDYMSNQNAFDATQLFVNPSTHRYYDFVEFSMTPSITRSFREGKWEATLAGNFGYRKYAHRRTQDGTGTYEDRLIYSAFRGATLTLRYHILKGLSAILTGNVLTYSSNTRYEANYPYNYTTASYLGGLSWEY